MSLLVPAGVAHYAFRCRPNINHITMVLFDWDVVDFLAKDDSCFFTWCWKRGGAQVPSRFNIMLVSVRGNGQLLASPSYH